MSSKGLTVVDGAAAGSWIEPKLSGGPGPLVKEQIPSDYDAYIRLFHPADDGQGNLVTWTEVAQRLGQTPHRQMQWHTLVGSANPASLAGSSWSGARPSLGGIDNSLINPLCQLLTTDTHNENPCYFGLSTIHGEV